MSSSRIAPRACSQHIKENGIAHFNAKKFHQLVLYSHYFFLFPYRFWLVSLARLSAWRNCGELGEMVGGFVFRFFNAADDKLTSRGVASRGILNSIGTENRFASCKTIRVLSRC